MRKLYIIINEDRFFLSHRKDIALAAQKDGWKVRIFCKDTGQRKEVEALGLEMTELPINPTGTNPKEELRTLRYLYNLYRKDRPDVVHHVGLKNILWGGIAARLSGTIAVVNAVSGLGVLFSGDSIGTMAQMILKGMAFANNRQKVKLIFQNMEDKKLFLDYHVAQKDQCEYIKGSGVNLTDFAYTPEPDTPPIRVILTSRMVKEKGIAELIAAAEHLRSEMEGRVEFLLCGCLHDNPKGYKEHELRAICDGKYIKWLGHRNDVRELLMQSHIVTLPSYYREGVPKSLIEAAAIGRPIVTTDSIGCRDTVDDGVNGFLVPVRNAKVLADKLRTLINDRQLRVEMGLKSRKKAEREFSIDNVICRHLEIYEKLVATTA